MHELAPLLELVRSTPTSSGELMIDLAIADDARPLGLIVDLEPEEITALAAAGRGIVIDTYGEPAS